VLVLSAGCDKAPAAREKQAMSTELTTDMRAHCLGRFLVDMPKEAIVASQSDRYGSVIEHLPHLSLEEFNRRVLQREKELREASHETEGSMLKQSLEPFPNSRLLVYRENRFSTYTVAIDAFVWKTQSLFRIRGGADDVGDKVRNAINVYSERLQRIERRAGNEIPTKLGFCIDGGFIPGSEYMNEFTEITFNFAKHRDVIVTISTMVNGDKVDEGLLARAARNDKDIEARLLSQIKELRRGKRAAGGLDGEELLTKVPSDDKQHQLHDFTWEAPGAPNALAKPTIRLDLITGRGKTQNDSVAPSLSDEEALALWDAILNSLRLRPGAV
jgi:Tle cognate immunity protein 4 C-terminal domain/Tle cognate immunity protein 4 N-terminal domain